MGKTAYERLRSTPGPSAEAVSAGISRVRDQLTPLRDACMTLAYDEYLDDDKLRAFAERHLLNVADALHSTIGLLADIDAAYRERDAAVEALVRAGQGALMYVIDEAVSEHLRAALASFREHRGSEPQEAW